MADFNERFLESIKLKEQREETLSKSVAFLQKKDVFDPLVEAIRNTSMSCFNSIFQEETAHSEDHHSQGNSLSMFKLEIHNNLINFRLDATHLPIFQKLSQCSRNNSGQFQN